MVRIIMNVDELMIHIFSIDHLKVKIIGIIKMISISKIKKITAIRKKWIEKGVRGYDTGLNPHSNGVDFCKSTIIFFLIVVINK